MASASLSGGYFGTRGPDMFSPYFLQSIAGGRFVDITAGTGRFPFHLATRERMKIGLVERCPYVGMMLQSIFMPEAFAPEKEQVDWHPKQHNGYLCHRGDLEKTINYRTASLVDGFMLANKGGLARHCMARAVSRHFGYRNHNFCITGADGIKGPDRSFQFVADTARKTYVALRKLRLRFAKHWVVLGDSCAVMAKLDLDVKGATVYADPAWPYATKTAGPNPYLFAYEELSSIMLQRQLSLDTVWTVERAKQIYRDVELWISSAFEMGARQFILCSQDTNFPDELILKQWVVDHRQWKLLKHERREDTSFFSNRKYTTFWFYIQPR